MKFLERIFFFLTHQLTCTHSELPYLVYSRWFKIKSAAFGSFKQRRSTFKRNRQQQQMGRIFILYNKRNTSINLLHDNVNTLYLSLSSFEHHSKCSMTDQVFLLIFKVPNMNSVSHEKFRTSQSDALPSSSFFLQCFPQNQGWSHSFVNTLNNPFYLLMDDLFPRSNFESGVFSR